MKDIFSVFKERRWIMRMIIVGILFLACAAPFRMMLSLVLGMTEVRPANMIPVVFGILWGPAAAWGISIANAISDILVSHSPVQVWLPGFFINFFYAYLPYKMWYSIDYKRNGIVKPRLGKVYDILKFIWICFVDSLVTTVLLALLFEYLGFQSYSSSAVFLIYCCFWSCLLSLFKDNRICDRKKCRTGDTGRISFRRNSLYSKTFRYIQKDPFSSKYP